MKREVASKALLDGKKVKQFLALPGTFFQMKGDRIVNEKGEDVTVKFNTSESMAEGWKILGGF